MQITLFELHLCHVGIRVNMGLGFEMTYATYIDKSVLYQVSEEMIVAIRSRPNEVETALDALSNRQELIVDMLSDGRLPDDVASHPAFEAFARTAFKTIDLALTLAKLDAAAANQMTRDFATGEWVALTLNSKGWIDALLLMHAMQTGQVRPGWRSGFGAKMTALWNFIESEQQVTEARMRLYWLRAVSFGDAAAMMSATDALLPADMPRNGALQAETHQRLTEISTLQAQYDQARRELVASLPVDHVEYAAAAAP